MTFEEAIKKLGIEEYGERIWNSNSHGELFHLNQYIRLAEMEMDFSKFPGWFKEIVKQAEENWERPESVFQHIYRILYESLKYGDKDN